MTTMLMMIPARDGSKNREFSILKVPTKPRSTPRRKRSSSTYIKRLVSPIPKPKLGLEEVRRKIERLKYTRDYSFLFFDDAEPPKTAPNEVKDDKKLVTSQMGSKNSSLPKGIPARPCARKKWFNNQGEEEAEKAIGLIRKMSNEVKDEKNLVTSQMGSKNSSLLKGILAPPLKRRATKKWFDQGEVEAEKAISLIRKMFGYNPEDYVGLDDDDGSMEASFHDILNEERLSSRIASKEDRRELCRIKEEREKWLKKRRGGKH